MPRDDRFLIVRPFGGFNDMLCQLEFAWRHARRHGRRLVADTTDSGLLDDLFAYYDLRPDYRGRILPLAETGLRLTATETGTRLQDAEGRALFERAWPRETRLDPRDDPPDRYILHASAGGGELGVDFLARLTLKPEAAAEIAPRLAPLGRDYTAIHIRNTDYRTDYARAFEAARPLIRGRKVLLCSDDSTAILHFKETYGAICRFHTTSALHNLSGRTLHYAEAEDRRAVTLDMLTDFYALASGARICMVDTKGAKRSGFAVLAAHCLRRLGPGAPPDCLELGPRLPCYLRAMARGRPFRVWRARAVRFGGTERYLLHPTYE